MYDPTQLEQFFAVLFVAVVFTAVFIWSLKRDFGDWL